VPYTAARWNPKEFATAAEAARATLCSLVPTQIYDLVQARLTAPKTLRAVIVGGAALGEDVYRESRALGWPVLPSYGMTEAASQIATASLGSLSTQTTDPSLRVLPHLQVEIGPNDGRIRIRGASLLTGIIQPDKTGKPKIYDPKDVEGWLTTDDFGTIGPNGLTVLGRVQDRSKIGGELVNLAALRRVFEEEANRLGVVQAVALTVIPDARLESVIALVYEPEADPKINELRKRFDARVMPYERIRHVRRVTKIPRTELGKIKWSELSALAQEQ
jgi:O-succinylbenzoic acid--CoA ligase